MSIELTTKDRCRFEDKVDRSGGPDSCHLWTGTEAGDGYGYFWLNGRHERAHRVAWVLAGNEITEEKPLILHDCPGGDSPMCCNARHLWNGTVADNQRDMAKKGRGRKSKRGLPFGVRPHGRRFKAQVRINGELIFLGTFPTAAKASRVALEAKACREETASGCRYVPGVESTGRVEVVLEEGQQ